MRKWWASAACILVGFTGCGDDVAIGRVENGDTFVQEGGHVTADILWVVDNSGTMSEEQESLEASLGAFIDALTRADIDFHLGVISTDVSDPATAGVLVGETPYLTRDSEDLEAEFTDRAMVGISGSRDELGFNAIRSALSEPLLSGVNAGFLRPEAELYIMIVSDEDDQSDLSVAEFEAFLRSVKIGAAVSVSALVGDAPFGCSSRSGAADPGTRYLQLAQESDGVVQSICAESYTPGLSRFVQLISHLRDTFELTRIADPSSIGVEVDGVELHNRATDGWQYLPDLNAVRISGTPLPLPGQEIYISYTGIRF